MTICPMCQQRLRKAKAEKTRRGEVSVGDSLFERVRLQAMRYFWDTPGPDWQRMKAEAGPRGQTLHQAFTAGTQENLERVSQ